MDFEIVGKISDIETIAVGSSIREIARLRRAYGRGRWRKLKGVHVCKWAMVESGLPSSTGTKRTVWARGKSSESGFWTRGVEELEDNIKFAVCVDNDGYPASLELHKIYRVLPDEGAGSDADLRVIDESGEDYLYPAERFVLLELPQAVEKSLLQHA